VSHSPQPELFKPEPPPATVSAEMIFSISLKDGSGVSVHFHRRFFAEITNVARFEYFGDSISSTGYKSEFPRLDFTKAPDKDIIKYARLAAEQLREERLREIAKKAFQRERNRR